MIDATRDRKYTEAIHRTSGGDGMGGSNGTDLAGGNTNGNGDGFGDGFAVGLGDGNGRGVYEFPFKRLHGDGGSDKPPECLR